MKKLLPLIFFLQAVLVSAQQGILDVTFGSGTPAGTEQISNPSTGFYEKAIALQSDGKIVISTGGGPVSLGRLKTDGSADPFFGSAGWKNLGNYAVGSIAIQSDGKILATGKPTVISYQDQYLWRLNTDASFDPTFGQNGRVNDTTLGGANEHLALLSGGQIMWAGINGFRKLNSDGTTDASWGNNGRLLINQLPIYISNIIADTINGFVIASGVTKTQNNIAVIRITPTGQVDGTFGYGGIDSIDYTVNILGFSQDLKFGPTGKIVLGADYTDGTYDHVLCAQFNADGTRDNLFGTSGVMIPNWNAPNNEAFLGGIGIQSDERILFACSSRDTTVSGFYYDILTQRINSTGTYDAAYGITRLDINQANDLANAADIDADGKFVIVGKSGGSQLLARYTDGTTNIHQLSTSDIRIFPNPVSDRFSIHYSFAENAVLKIYDLTGRVVQSLNLSASFSDRDIDVSGLSGGVYILKINNGLSDFFTGKLVVK